MCSLAGQIVAFEIVLEALIGLAVIGWLAWLAIGALREDARKKNGR